mmetsp:Transcript_4134/g.9464  ORF Transcript_4134/g.9464 Transcript_4134/m.9464 type:complete len:134 (-) Transcript_4134:147-548(-)
MDELTVERTEHFYFAEIKLRLTPAWPPPWHGSPPLTPLSCFERKYSMLQSIMLSSVLDRPVCSRRERRKVDGELLHHHVYKRLLSGSSSSSVCETSLPDFLYPDLSSSSSDDTKKTLQPRGRGVRRGTTTSVT